MNTAGPLTGASPWDADMDGRLTKRSGPRSSATSDPVACGFGCNVEEVSDDYLGRG